MSDNDQQKQVHPKITLTRDNSVSPNKKIALITGGSRGIGKDIALFLAKMGIGVVLTYHSNKAEGDRTAEKIREAGGAAVALELDVALTLTFDTFLDRVRALLPEVFGPHNLDFLINNAGFGKPYHCELDRTWL